MRPLESVPIITNTGAGTFPGTPKETPNSHKNLGDRSKRGVKYAHCVS